MPRRRRLLKKLRLSAETSSARLHRRHPDRTVVSEPALGLDPRDEARVGQKGTHSYVWAPVGSRPDMVRDNRHDSAYLYGAICPARGIGAAIIMPAANTEAMNEHLKEISSRLAAGAHAVL